MGKEFSRYGWRWIFPLVGLVAWLSLGCSPQSLTMLAGAFDGDRVDPEYKIFTSKDEVTLVLLTHFDPPEFRTEVVPVKDELTDKLGKFILSRCQENKHKVKIVPEAKVRSYVMKQKAEGDYSPVDVGQHFKADFVLDLSIQSCDIYEKKMSPPAYNGNAAIDINLYKMKDGDQPVFPKSYHGVYPGERGTLIEATAMSVSQFRGYFVNKLACDISKIFIAYPQQEKHMFD